MPESAIIHLIAAARPNFMKVAPLLAALRLEPWCRPVLVHTGQHYDHNMSDVFFQDLGIGEIDVNLGVGSGSHAEQTGKVMMAYEQLLLRQRPRLTVVCGDVNSTIACALAAAKLCVPVAHLEAGLRSFDRTMPEEINRVCTDSIADILWTPSPDADEHLLREGVAPERIQRVGNIMIDTLEIMRRRVEERAILETLGLAPRAYCVVTLHRPSNVDVPSRLAILHELLLSIAQNAQVVLPLHPRTRSRLEDQGLLDSLRRAPGVHLLEPQGYCDFMKLVFEAAFVLTDSGGIQEETSYLGVPCLTLRDNTERPVTITHGTNRLVSLDTALQAAREAENAPRAPASIEFWDGHAASRVVADLRRRLGMPPADICPGALEPVA